MNAESVRPVLHFTCAALAVLLSGPAQAGERARINLLDEPGEIRLLEVEQADLGEIGYDWLLGEPDIGDRAPAPEPPDPRDFGFDFAWVGGHPERPEVAINGGSTPLSADHEDALEKREDATVPPRVQPAVPGSGRLLWRNGESLGGKAVGGSGDILQWESPVFAAPLRISTGVLQRVESSNSRTLAEGTFRLILTDGSHLSGSPVSLTEKVLTFDSSRCGRLEIQRDSVASLERIAGAGVLAGGPQALLANPDTKADNNQPRPAQPWYTAAAGLATTPSFRQAARLPWALPDKGRVSFVLTTPGAPEFSVVVSFGDFALTVTTWDDELVLTDGKSFVSAGVRTSEEVHRLALCLGWDRESGRFTLYGPDSTEWAVFQAEPRPASPAETPPATPEEEAKPGPMNAFFRALFGAAEEPQEDGSTAATHEAGPAGITVYNKSPELTVEHFTVSADTTAPPPFAERGVVTATESLDAVPVSLTDGTLTFLTAAGETRALPLDSVRAIRLGRWIRTREESAKSDLWFTDGDSLHGHVERLEDGAVLIRTAFAAEPVRAQVERQSVLTFPGSGEAPAAPKPGETDVLTSGKVVVHGKMSATGDTLPHFQLTGAVESVAPAAGNALTITRALPPDGIYERAPALVHITTGESLPVTLTGVDSKAIGISWDAAEAKSVDASLVSAVQLAVPATGSSGFDAGGWHTTGKSKKKPGKREDGSIILPPGMGLAHSTILQGGEDLTFRMGRDRQNNGGGIAALRVRLFTGRDRKTGNTGGLSFLLGDFGGQIYAGVESSEGQMNNQTEIATSGEMAEIRITVSGTSAQLFVNNIPAGRAQLTVKNPKAKDKKPRAGTGLLIETTAMWGNQMADVCVGDFTTKGSPFMPGPPPFSQDDKVEALLLPRLRRDDPPRQILIGRNGDLLRGVIEGMTSTHLAFRAGLESFKVPLERVSAAVWVKKASATEPAAEEKEDKAKAPEAAKRIDPFGGQVEEEVNEIEPGEEGAEASDVADEPATGPEQWIDLTNGGRLEMKVEAWGPEFITAAHPVLGRCRIPLSLLQRMTTRAPGAAPANLELSGWELQNTPDPVLPDDGGGEASPLAGKAAEDFKLPLLNGESFSLTADAKNKVVVLDFWATWCGPCVKSLPGLVDAMSGFSPEEVVFLAVNQGEGKDQVSRFLEARGLKMNVGMDGDQSVARKYGVEGIPHTVVIGRDGKIAWTKTGYSPEGDKEVAAAVRKALDGGGDAAAPK